LQNNRNMNTNLAVILLASLAQESRLALFRLLVQRGKQGMAAGEIATQLNIPNSTLSFHLKALCQAELILARQESRYVYYSANFATMSDLINFLTENCCGSGESCQPQCPPLI
jgi:ArsR family transcriptional regulator, arsenate/arsenite/antimonite-responsive transcriptional repressor